MHKHQEHQREREDTNMRRFTKGSCTQARKKNKLADSGPEAADRIFSTSVP
jgi:hypothetical protein